MKKIRTGAEKSKNIVSHIVLGALLSLISLFIMSVILAIMVEKEVIPITAMPTFAMGIHAISVFVGSLLATILEKGRIAIVAAIVAVFYLLALLCVNMLIFSSGITGMGLTVIGSAIGGLAAVVIKGNICRSKKYRTKLRSR